MKNNSPLLPLLALALVTLSVLPDASAGERTRSREGARGGSAETTTRRERGDVDRDATWTKPDGGIGQHQYRRTWDPVAGTGTVSATTTRADGSTSGRDATLARTAPGSGTASGTYARANGATGVYEASSTKTVSGRETTRSATGSDGKTASVESAVTRTDSGGSRTVARTGPAGGTSTVLTDVTKTESGATATRTVTSTPPPPVAE